MRPSNLQALREEISLKYPTVETELLSFSSGASMLDIRLGGRFFVCAYSPRSGFSVDEILDDEGLGTHYKYTSESSSEALKQVLNLLAEASGM